jgi:hypothetical protein
LRELGPEVISFSSCFGNYNASLISKQKYARPYVKMFKILVFSNIWLDTQEVSQFFEVAYTDRLLTGHGFIAIVPTQMQNWRGCVQLTPAVASIQRASEKRNC